MITYKAVNVKFGALPKNEKRAVTIDGSVRHGETYAVYESGYRSTIPAMIGFVRAYYGAWPRGRQITRRWLTFGLDKQRADRPPQHERKSCFE